MITNPEETGRAAVVISNQPGLVDRYRIGHKAREVISKIVQAETNSLMAAVISQTVRRTLAAVAVVAGLLGKPVNKTAIVETITIQTKNRALVTIVTGLVEAVAGREANRDQIRVPEITAEIINSGELI